jgi:hypothetical protein
MNVFVNIAGLFAIRITQHGTCIDNVIIRDASFVGNSFYCLNRGVSVLGQALFIYLTATFYYSDYVTAVKYRCHEENYWFARQSLSVFDQFHILFNELVIGVIR